MAQVQPTQDRFISLDSWRGIAAALVAVSHFHANNSIAGTHLLENLRLFVDFFFILSGFVIAKTYRDRLSQGLSIKHFMALRVGRLWPLHVTILLALFGIELARWIAGVDSSRVFVEQNSIENFVASFFLVQSLGYYPQAANGPAWSISTELWTYLIFALVTTLLFRWYRLSLSILAASAFCFLISAEHLPEWTHVWTFMGRCVFGFFVGALLFELYSAKPFQDAAAAIPKAGYSGLELLSILGVVLLLFLARLSDGGPMLDHINTLAVPVFSIVVLVFAFERGVVSKLLRNPFPVLLGTLSYSIYLTHELVQTWGMTSPGYLVQKVTGLTFLDVQTRPDGAIIKTWGVSQLQGDISTIVMLVIVIGFSYLSYRTIEQPGRQYVRNVLSGKQNWNAPIATLSKYMAGGAEAIRARLIL